MIKLLLITFFLLCSIPVASAFEYNEITITGKINKIDKTQDFGQPKLGDSKTIKKLKKGYKDKEGKDQKYKDPE